MCEHLITDRTTRSPEATAARLATLLRKGSQSQWLGDPLEFRARIAGVSAGLGRDRVLETQEFEGYADIRTLGRLFLSVH